MTLRGPIRLRPKMVYWIWVGCFPTVRILVFRGVRLSGVRWKRGKPVDNPFECSFVVSGSGHGLTTLPTLSAVGAGLGVGATGLFL